MARFTSQVALPSNLPIVGKDPTPAKDIFGRAPSSGKDLTHVKDTLVPQVGSG